MILRAFRHVGFAVWLGVFALAVGNIQQGQLSTDVITAAMDDAAMMAKMGHDMAHHKGTGGGHSHKGHADCEVCGAVAAMGFVTVPVAALVPIPQLFAKAQDTFAVQFTFAAARFAPYASRAPPTLLS